MEKPFIANRLSGIGQLCMKLASTCWRLICYQCGTQLPPRECSPARSAYLLEMEEGNRLHQAYVLLEGSQMFVCGIQDGYRRGLEMQEQVEQARMAKVRAEQNADALKTQSKVW